MTKLGLTYSGYMVPLILEAKSRGLIQMIEVVPDESVRDNGHLQLLAHLKSIDLPYSFHFVGHSICSADFLTNNNCELTRSFLEHFSPMLVSDHLTCSRVGDHDLECNLPIVMNQDALDIYSANIEYFKNHVKPKCTFLLEHVPNYYEF